MRRWRMSRTLPASRAAQCTGISRDKDALLAAMCERAALPMEAMMACCGGNAQLPPLATLRNNAVQALMRLARDPRTLAVFDVFFNKSAGRRRIDAAWAIAAG